MVYRFFFKSPYIPPNSSICLRGVSVVTMVAEAHLHPLHHPNPHTLHHPNPHPLLAQHVDEHLGDEQLQGEDPIRGATSY